MGWEPPSHHQLCDTALCVLFCVPNLPLLHGTEAGGVGREGGRREKGVGRVARSKQKICMSFQEPAGSSGSKQLRELRRQAWIQTQTTSPPSCSSLRLSLYDSGSRLAKKAYSLKRLRTLRQLLQLRQREKKKKISSFSSSWF